MPIQNAPMAAIRRSAITAQTSTGLVLISGKRGDRGGEATQHDRCLTANDHQAQLTGNANAQRRQQQRRGTLHGVLDGKPAAERAAPDETR